MDSNRKDGIVFRQPTSHEERKAAAGVLVERLKYRLPLALDGMDGRAERAFSAWPERIYILGSGGRVLYKGGMGPFDFDPLEAEKSLVRLVGTPPASAPPARPGG
jgi:type I thyroxine 5'-deiodinase